MVGAVKLRVPEDAVGKTNEGGHHLPLQNMSLWHEGYFRRIIFKKQQTQGKLWKLCRREPFVKSCFHGEGKSSFVSVSPCLYQEKEDDFKSQETLINKEGNDLNPHNLPLVY